MIKKEGCGILRPQVIKMFNLTFEASPYLIIPVLFFSLGLTFLLYFKSKNLDNQPFYIKAILSSLRFVSIFIIGILLLSPFIKSISEDIQKPIVAIVQDASSSINLHPDSQYLEKLNGLSTELSKDFEVHPYSFGDQIQPQLPQSFDDKSTNISEVFSFLYNQYSKRNLSAIILASDGIYNRGMDPVFQQNKPNAPVFAIGLGDTIRKKDLILKNVLHNDLVYLNDQFTVQVDISGFNLSGQKSQLNIYKWRDNKKSLVNSIPFEVQQNDLFLTKEVILKADQPGTQKFSFELSPIQNEFSLTNNQREIYIDVLDSRKKIAIIAHAPHPDIHALKQSISGAKNYEVTVFFAKELSKFNSKDFDLLVLHQLPSMQYPIPQILQEKDKSKFFIIGQATSLNDLNKNQSMVSIIPGNGNPNEVQVSSNKNFNLFSVEEEWEKMFSIYPPILSPFASFSLKNNTKVWWYQNIGKIETEYPLLVFEEKGVSKSALLLGEGIWKWRLFDFLQNENHQNFDQMISKIIQFISQKEDKRRLRVAISSNIIDENQPVLMDAFLYNKNFELINTPKIDLILKDQNGKNFNFDFLPTSKLNYQLNTGVLPKGTYEWVATTTHDGDKLTHTGNFTIREIQLEQNESTANHSLLSQLSEETGGEFIPADNLMELASKIESKPIVFENTQRVSGISLKWIFAILIITLSGEWFIRRYVGTY